MTEEQVQPVSTELSDRLCEIVNEILAMFNQKNVTPSEAGTVVLALIHRLMGVLQDNPEVQRAFRHVHYRRGKRTSPGHPGKR